VNAAVNTLDALGVITVDRSGRANGVQIDPEMFVKSADPVTAIPQPEYHGPVRALLGEHEKRITADIGVILFGSVARGTADRTSDIDLSSLSTATEWKHSVKHMPSSETSLTNGTAVIGMRHIS